MPKKSTRDSRSIGRTSWKPKSVKRNSNEKRILNNIYIGAGNARRWIILKKKLDYQSDVDFVAFLLDLAEPHSVKQVTTKDPEEDDKKDDDDEDENEVDLPLRDFEEDTNDSTSSLQQEISDDGEWKPSGTSPEGPLRRSPRKPPIPLRIHVRRSARNVLPESTSTSREQKDKLQHKEEKKKKEKKDDDDDPVESCFLEEENKNKVLDEDRNGEEQEDTKEKEEREVITETNAPAINSELECVQEEAEAVPQNDSLEAKNDPDKTAEASELPVEEGQHDKQTNEQHRDELEVTEGEQQTVLVSTAAAEKENTDECLPNLSDEVRIEVGERVKLKRRKKKRSHSVDDQNADHSHSSKHKRKKHKHGEHSTKKKHHDIRKAPQDGILKEPTENCGNIVASADCTNKEHGDRWMEEMGPKINEVSHPQHHDMQVSLQVQLPEHQQQPQQQPQQQQQQQQQQRVAIRIKLCCDCNSRHIQDACPLRNPSIIIGDAVIFGQWKNENCSLKSERTNVILSTPVSTDSLPGIACESRGEDQDSSTQPELIETLATLRNGRSEFHETSNNSISESRDSIFTNTQKMQCDRQEFNAGVGVQKWERTNCIESSSNHKSAIETGVCNSLESGDVKLFPKESCNAKQELTFAEASLPLGLELQVCDPEHGPSVVTRCKLQQYTQFGPLVGQPIREMDIPDDFNMKDIWEVFSEKERLYLSTFDPNCSNWLRYVRPAPVRDQRNLVPIVRHGELYFVTVVDIAEGEELLYWADDTGTTWSKKKMEKTNCGGCNLRFSHPLYYRTHCTVFHDPNFSLTIRKYHCKVCGTAVLGKENIMKHAAEMHDGKGAYQCQYCKKFFLRLNYLEMHRTYGCASNPQRTRPLCDFCGRKFCQPQKLKVHIKRMHSDMAEVLREFQCKICLKLLGSRAALQRHMKEVHHKDIVGACTCDRCGKMFQNKSNLKIHMLTHSGVKPFKCRENGCVAAFTTKQCLQFHYKKVHRFSEETMPVIERSVAYTFDAYSGGIVEEPGRGKTPRFDKERRNSTDNNSSSLMSMDDSSSASSVKADVSATSSNTECNSVPDDKGGRDGPPRLTPPPPPLPNEHTGQQPPMLEPYITQNSMFGAIPNKVVMSKGSKKWMGDAITTVEAHRHLSQEEMAEKSSGHDVYEFEEEKEVGEVSEVGAALTGEEDEVSISIVEPVRPKTPPPMYRRPESNASLLVEAALNAAERDIEMSGSCSVIGSSVNSPTVITASDIDKQNGEPLYSMAAATSTHHMVNGHHHEMTSSPPMHHSSQSPPNNHLDDYTLQQAGRELVSPATTPDQHTQNMSPEESSPSSHLQHLDSYTLQRDEMTSSPTHHLHRPQVIDPYNLHHQEDLISPAETPAPAPSRSSHLVDGYNLHHQEEIMSPAGTPDNHRSHIESYSLHHQEELVSPAATPTPRYEMHHHQVPTDNLSSDEGEGVVVAQNLSLGVKEKALQLDLAAAAAAYKQYEALEAVQEFGRSSGERPSFEPLLVGTTPELQGLDMSARSGSGYHHSFVSASSQSMSRYHHASVLYDMTSAERQSVDLSMTGRGSGYAPSPPPPPYSHSEVLRVVSLDLTTPVGRHSVDLSLSRSSTTVMSHHAPPTSHHSHHHHHQLPPATRVMTSSPDPRVAATPAPPGTPNHVVPELSRGAALMSPLPTVGNQGLVEPGRIMSPPPHPGYQSYPLSPSPYHPPSRTPHITSTSPTTYHHYSGHSFGI